MTVPAGGHPLAGAAATYPTPPGPVFGGGEPRFILTVSEVAGTLENCLRFG